MFIVVAKAASVGFPVGAVGAVALRAVGAVANNGVDLGQLAALIGAAAAMISAIVAGIVAVTQARQRRNDDPLATELGRRLLEGEVDDEILDALAKRRRRTKRART